MKLSVLDLIDLRVGQTVGESLRASRELVRAADRLGFTRYWVAEHHNAEAVVSTTPALELMYLGEGTSQIRLGSGGVMLPNHAPLAVAEQFALLSAVYGDRVDLGIGRAPGTDPVTSAAIRGHLDGGHWVSADGRPTDPVHEFPRNIADILALLAPGGAEIPLRGRDPYRLRATPELLDPPQVWLLGSSDYSAQLAAAMGLPYVFAHHFSGRGTQRALDLYRGDFQPGPHGVSPRTFLSMNVAVADTADEAWDLVEPYLHAMGSFLSGRGMARQRLAGDDVKAVLTDDLRQVMADAVSSWAVGNVDQVAAQLRDTAAEFGVDEIMIHPVCGARPGDPADSWPARLCAFELLAGALL